MQIRLQFDRNQDLRTNFYYVYRSQTPAVDRRSLRVMKVYQLAAPNPVLTHDTPRKMDEQTYHLNHLHVFESMPIIVRDNGATLDVESYHLDTTTGVLRLDTIPIGTIEVEYYFDGMEIVDDLDSNPNLELEYYGPPATDNNPSSPPTNVSMTAQGDGTIDVHYTLGVNSGQHYYYAIEARSEAGDYSQLSPVVHAHIQEPVAGVSVESSMDGTTWKVIGQSDSTPFHDDFADHEPPEGLVGASFEIDSGILAEGEEVPVSKNLTFTWGTPLLNDKMAFTPKYRLRSRLANGVLSNPSSIVGPELVKTPIQKIVVRRKTNSGSFPTYNDPLAETVAEITDFNSGSYTHEVIAQRTYAYSLFVVDMAGNYSSATTFMVLA